MKKNNLAAKTISPAPSTSSTMLTKPVTDASAWRAADFKSDKSFIVNWPKAGLAELDAAVKFAKQSGAKADTMTRSEFPLPTMGDWLKTQRQEVEYGRGFVLLRGIEVARYSEEEMCLMFSGIGTHLGKGLHQNSKGHRLGHVKDEGYADYRGRSDIRGYQTRASLEFHTDVVDIVGLMCLQTAKEGGQSLIVSSTTIHNEMLAHQPMQLGLLYGTYIWDMRGEINGRHYYPSPIYSWYKNYLSCRPSVFEYILSAQAKSQIPLSTAQREALDCFTAHCLSPDLQLSMEFHPGDIQMINNSVILHARTGYIDHEEPHRKRHILRLWINVENGRPIDPAFPRFE